ncbi:MAG TPA: amidohydrolase family protein [Candidatus Dormibacteraeota bacterium]|nr:amidohydrolase family protein [Candidatus Dormibacteraeota bacterium]
MIDCDVPLAAPSVSALRDHLPPYWRDQVAERGIRSLEPSYEPPGRTPRRPEVGPGTTQAILRPVAAVEALHAQDLVAALASALNDWLRAEWLDRDPRLRGSITLPPQSPELAVQEIDRLAGDRRFVQALLPLRGEQPLGRRAFWPVYDACARHGLAVAVRPGGNVGAATTPVGWPSHLVEDLAGQAQAFQSQVASLVLEGALQRSPELRFVLVASGVAWLPSLMWRLDKNWKGVRREVPWVERAPSEAIRRAVRLTAPPFDAPTEAFAEVLAHLGEPAMLLHAGAAGGPLPPGIDYDANARQTYARLRN